MSAGAEQRAAVQRNVLTHTVPAMTKGFLIQAGDESLWVEAGRLNDRIRDLIEHDARLQLMRIEVVELEHSQGAAA
jgi:hypothetical protein